MPSYLESRIIRLEQQFPDVSRRLVKLRALNGQNLQNFNAIRASVGDGTPPSNPVVFTDPTCSVGLTAAMLMTDSQWGTCTLNWQTRGSGLIAPHSEAAYTAAQSNAWQGCKSITFGGTTSATMWTVFPPSPSFPGQYSFYEDAIFSGGVLAAGTCGSTFNGSFVIPPPGRSTPACGPPWLVAISASQYPTGPKSLTFSM